MLQSAVGWALFIVALAPGFYCGWANGFVEFPSEDGKRVVHEFSFMHCLNFFLFGLLVGQGLLGGVRLLAYLGSLVGLWPYLWVSGAIALPYSFFGL